MRSHPPRCRAMVSADRYRVEPITVQRSLRRPLRPALRVRWRHVDRRLLDRLRSQRTRRPRHARTGGVVNRRRLASGESHDASGRTTSPAARRRAACALPRQGRHSHPGTGRHRRAKHGTLPLASGFAAVGALRRTLSGRIQKPPRTVLRRGGRRDQRTPPGRIETVLFGTAPGAASST